MFQRKKTEQEERKRDMASGDDLEIPAKPGQRPGITPVKPAGLPPRFPGELARSGPAPFGPGGFGGSSPAPAPEPETELRKLIVGREIALSGEIKSCDRLVVEGSVEANLANCRDIDIAESGLFKGSASIEEAEIRGRFEGSLNVRGRLLIRGTGQVVGTVRYGQIEIELGGQISGDVQSLSLPVQSGQQYESGQHESGQHEHGGTRPEASPARQGDLYGAGAVADEV